MPGGTDIEREKLSLELALREREPSGGGEEAASPPVVSGALPLTTRAALSFTKSPEEQHAYLEQQYPGSKISKSGADEIIQIPGEKYPRYVKEPGWGVDSLADYVGAIPEAAGGFLAGAETGALGAGAGLAAGTAAKKAIGYGLIGIPRKDSIAENALESALSGVVGGTVHAALPLVPVVAKMGKNAIGAAARKVMGLIGRGASKEAAPVAETLAADSFGPRAPVPVPKSLEGVSKIVEDAKGAGADLDLPTAKTLKGGEKYLSDLKYPLLEPQKEALASKGANARFQTLKSDPNVRGSKQILDYEALQKQELGGALDSTLGQHAGRAPVEGTVERGEGAIKSLVDKYEANKKLFGEAIGKYKDTPIDPAAHMDAFRDRLRDAFPGLKKYTDPDTGKLLPYTRGSGLTSKVYGMVDDVNNLMSSKELTLPEIGHIRESLRQEIDATNPQEAIPINRLRSAMLDHIQDLVQKVNPGADVRGAFRGYAKNEGNLEQLEKVMGGDLSSLSNFTQKVKPEAALPRIFKDTNSVQLAKEAYGQDFKGLASDFVQHLKEQATDANGMLSSAKFSTLLRKNQPALAEAFKTNPGALKRIQAIADRMRIIPDAPAFNSSNTAAGHSILEAAKHAAHLGSEAVENPSGALKSLAMSAKGMLERRAATKELDTMLSGAEPTHGGGLMNISSDQKRQAAALLASRQAQEKLARERENQRGLLR